ncbi:hypothetical protein HDU76_010726 [Blyttiomyces sp. JEL0837]|nr:hypothetical protein HDU76_010726 [Blyttiomyces sp. JEL0837]
MSTLESNRFYIPIEGLERGEMDLICKEIVSFKSITAPPTPSIQEVPASRVNREVSKDTIANALTQDVPDVNAKPINKCNRHRINQHRQNHIYDKQRRLKASKYWNDNVQTTNIPKTFKATRNEIEDEKLEAHKRIYEISRVRSCGSIDEDVYKRREFTSMDFVENKSGSILCQDSASSTSASTSPKLTASSSVSSFTSSDIDAKSSISTVNDINMDSPAVPSIQVLNVPLASAAAAFETPTIETPTIDTSAENPRSIANEAEISESIDIDSASSGIPKKWWNKIVEFVLKMVKKLKKAFWSFQDVLGLVKRWCRKFKGLDKDRLIDSRLEETVAGDIMDRMSTDICAGDGVSSTESENIEVEGTAGVRKAEKMVFGK